jgi:purine-binding chemotaxis protein CheW
MRVAETPLQRALAQAPSKAVAASVKASGEFFVFRLGSLNFGIASTLVREVTRFTRLTALPHAPAFLLGVLSHRGAVYPLLDLLRFFSQGESRPSDEARVFLCEVGASRVAFLADKTLGLQVIDAASVLDVPLSGALSSEYILGLVHQDSLPTLHLIELTRVVAAARAKVLGT